MAKRKSSGFDTFLNVKSPLMRPLWVRLAITVLTSVWTVVEFVAGNWGFGVIFLAASAYLIWQFFVTFDASDFAPRDTDPDA